MARLFRPPLGLVAALACVGLSASRSEAATLNPGFAETLFAGDFMNPTAMEFAPDGRLFVCEQAGHVHLVGSNGVKVFDPFVIVTANSEGERGLLGIAFDPNFAVNHFVYLYYTATIPTIHNRVSRFTADGDVAVPGSEVVILELETLGATNHNGGAIHFGPDGKLYVAVGENAVPSNSQTLTNRLGKMLRINADGTIPTDNPFFADPTVSGNNKAIWALGLRNPFTFSFQNGTGRMFINDVGAATFEEINDGIAGSNYGWPNTEGPTADPSFRSPLFAYGHGAGTNNGCAITGGAFYNPSTVTFPVSHVGDYFFADFCNGWIRKFDPTDSSVSVFATGISSPVDLKVHSDGALYYLARGAGAVFRVQSTSPVLSINDVTVAEPLIQTPANFTVTLSETSSETVTVDFATADGTAHAGSDYSATSGTLTFMPGETTKTVSVTIFGDADAPVDEFDETFFVNLSNPAGASISDSQGVGTILDTSPPPNITINDVTAVEGNHATRSFVFTVTLSHPSDKVVTVNGATADGTASSGTDYMPNSNTSTFPPGLLQRFFNVAVFGDTKFEATETFFVNLSGATNAVITDSQGVGTITNDDTQATRVFVSSTGSDDQDCREVTTPCRTFQEAIFQVAAGGEVIVRKSGSYGGVTISKAVTIHAPKGVVAFTAAPITVAAGASDVVVLRGLTVKALTLGSGTGITFNSGAALYMENVVVDGWNHGVDAQAPGKVFVTDTTIRNSADAGLRVTGSAGTVRVAIDRSRFEGNGGCGVEVVDGALVTVRSSVAAGNASGFCVLAGAASQLSILGSMAANNVSSGISTSAGTARASRCVATGNAIGFQNAGGTFESLGNNLVVGNGTDATGTITVVAAR
jgi:glucose/arabinose dehydrogenase